MSDRPFRFIHTSDMHLEQPLQGVNEVPEQLIELFLDAPFLAAESVFDAAIREQVDAVIVVGDLISPQLAGPRGMDFAMRQFRRMQSEEIDIFWVRGELDAMEDWPASVPLPANVHLFDGEHVDAVTVRVAGRPVAVIQGRGAITSLDFSTHEFDADASLPTIAAVYGRVKEPTFAARDIDYWALGGVHQPQLTSSAENAYYCGTPQGRRPNEEGPHGCALVQVDLQGNVTRQFLTADAARWQNIKIDMPDDLDRVGLLRMLRDRTHQSLTEAGGRPVLLRWVMTDSNEGRDTHSDLLAARLREGGLAEEILQSLRHEFGASDPPVWHFEIEVEPPTVLPSGWYEEDTVLGDLLRCVQKYQADASQSFPLESVPADSTLSDELREALKTVSHADRDMTLRRVAALGVDLLRGDRVLSAEIVSPKRRTPAAGGL